MIVKTFLIFTIILASGLRLIALDTIPPSLFSDEVDLGYQTYSILKTGRDYSGNLLPVHPQSSSDFRAPLYIYLTIPFVATFGLNEWTVRLLASISGILSVALIYFLVIKLGFNRWVGLLSSLSLAISPWNIHYSRAGFEVTLMLLLIICAQWLFLKGLENKIFLIFSSVAFILAMYTYSTAKLFVPLFIIVLILIYKKYLLKSSLKWKAGLLILLIVLLIPLSFDTISGKAGFRFSYTNIFANPTIPAEIDVQRSIDTGSETLGTQPTILSKINHNKLLSFGDSFIKNYLSSFSTGFLFLDGDPIRRHAVGKMGQFYLFEAASIFVGLFLLLKIKTAIKSVLLAWILLAPVPAALTVEGGNHATRLILLLPPLIILSGLGFEAILKYFFSRSRTKLSLSITFIIVIVSFYFYMHRYFTHYPLEQERIWHFGFKQSILKAENFKNSFDKILFTESVENPIPFILFWTKFPPKNFQQMKGTKIMLDKYTLGNLADKELIDAKTLIIAAPKDFPKKNLEEIDLEGFTLLDSVKYSSGETVFMLLKKNE